MDRAGNVGGETALVLDAAGRPHISYHDIMGNALKYAYLTGATWRTETVSESVGAGLDPALALDRAGFPHISYYDPASEELKYARRTQSGWEIQVVEHTGNVGMSSALALDPADHPVIVYHKVAEGVLKTAWWTGTQWLYQDLEQIGTLAPSYTSLLVAADGIPHVAYYDVAAGDLKYARGLSALPTAGWEITTVDSAGRCRRLHLAGPQRGRAAAHQLRRLDEREAEVR